MLLLIIWRIAPRLPQPRASLETYLVKSLSVRLPGLLLRNKP